MRPTRVLLAAAILLLLPGKGIVENAPIALSGIVGLVVLVAILIVCGKQPQGPEPASS